MDKSSESIAMGKKKKIVVGYPILLLGFSTEMFKTTVFAL